MSATERDQRRNGHQQAQTEDVDPQETREWLEALEAVVREDGPERASALLKAVLERARKTGVPLEVGLNTPYVNTIPPDRQPEFPGDPVLERKLRSLVRWNAIATVLRANKESSELGGHIASYQSAAVLYEVGFNHFWRAPTEQSAGDLVYIQGHSSPGIYARAYLEGRIDEEQMLRFRQEVGGGGLSSYPHPWLMPGFWQFPTVSMGLGPLMAIGQAHFMKYLQGRELLEPSDRKVWAFMGDGEMDEPESMGNLALAGREKLDNLIFVVNCNLQRLDGPVRGNGKVIQELERSFRGAGWNVIKVIWGDRWDPLLAADETGALVRRMEEALDGDYQTYKSRDGAYVREHFFDSPELKRMVEDLTDEEVWALNRGGHDQAKVFAAYQAAVQHKGEPTVILAKTIKGYGMGEAGEGQNITHQQKKMNEQALRAFRDRFELDVSDDEVREIAFHRPPDDAPEMVYLRERREALGGSLPVRVPSERTLPVPELAAFKTQLEGSGDREISTTMAFVRILATLLRDKGLKDHVVPIVPDESRTFGMEGMFRQLGIFSQVGQLYSPEDADSLMFYKEDRKGQMLQMGIDEPGALAEWIAAATSYANHGVPMVPMYIFYSMFGFQRVMDLIWAAGDSRARGFLLGGTSGRTTLNGEGLQHEDGHSQLLASVVPNCVSYDPTYAYELAVIVREGLRRMVGEREDVFFYVTLMNENWQHPPLPDGAEEGILRGLHRIAGPDGDVRVRLLGSGAILREVEAAAAMLRDDFGVESEVWSATSFTELARDGMACERQGHLTGDAGEPWVRECLPGEVPVVAATDYVRAYADQVRPYLDAPYAVLGTDGYGRSDFRKALRSFFEVDRRHVVLAALRTLGMDDEAAKAVEQYEIDVEAEAPWRR